MSLIEPLPSPRVICTLGMHRSGTSVVSRLLNLLGVHLGAPADLSALADDNPKGHWEHYPLSLINDEVLALFGGRWDEPPVFPPAWPSDPRLADIRERAQRLLNDSFARQPLWGWKDPRTCLTLPFWQDLVGTMRYVICIRNPAAVIASLQRRDHTSIEKAERLWLTHVQSSMAHTAGQERMFVFYEDIIKDWPSQLRRLAAFIGEPSHADDPIVRASVGEFFEEELCHHRVSMADLAGDRQISFAVSGLYFALAGQGLRGLPRDEGCRDICSGQALQKTMNLVASRAFAAWDERVLLTAERSNLATGNQVQATVISKLETERNRLNEEAGALLVDRGRKAIEADNLRTETRMLSARCSELAAREQQLLEATTRLDADLRSAIAARDQQRQDHAVAEQRLIQAASNLRADLQSVTVARDREVRQREAAEQVLQEIRTSFAWGLVAATRQAIVSGLPAGTRRRQVFHALLRRISPRPEPAPQAVAAAVSINGDRRQPLAWTAVGHGGAAPVEIASKR